MYDTETWQRNLRGGKPIARSRHIKPPCRKCPKCQGENAQTPAVGRRNTLSRRNLQTLQAYHEHQAAGGEMKDPVLRKHFGIIRQLIDVLDRAQRRTLLEIMAARPPI